MTSTAAAARLYPTRLPEPGYFRALTPCREACPVKTDACAYVQAIGRGSFDEAYRIARVPNPLASICGRICGAPCETACRRGVIDEPVAIRALKRAAFEHSELSEPGSSESMARISALLRTRDLDRAHGLLDFRCSAGAFRDARVTGKSIGIIGSGPAGLSCAHDLALLGHGVRIYEMEPVAAGMLTLGIPAYRLPRRLVEDEIRFIEQLGVEIQTDCEVGKDVSFDALLKRHDAIVVAVGAKRSRLLPVPGIEGPGVMGGVEFLREINLGRSVKLGSKVVVVGGGNVAYDVARSAIRRLQLDVSRVAARERTVESVSLVCLESREEMPADEIEILEGAEEGLSLLNRLGPDAIERDADGRVLGLGCKGVERVFDEQGRFSPTFNEQRRTLEADTILIAIGQRFETGFLEQVAGLELDRNGAPAVRDGTRTTHSKVWVAGDLAHGPKLAIDAIASGKAVARSIHEVLTGVNVEPKSVEVHLPRPNFQRERDYELRKRSALPVLPPHERVVEPEELVERSPSELWARHEAGRCLNCSVNTILDPEMCVLCGGCVDVCPLSCLKLIPTHGLSLVSEDGTTAPPPEATAMIKDETACIRCGLCAHRCPTDAITMQRCVVEEAS